MTKLKNQIILTMLLLFVGGPVHLLFADDHFAINLSYTYPNGMLEIQLERLSKDEIKDFMQRLVVYKDKETQLEENMINQNHLHKITKLIPYQAQPGDTIHVDLYYGEDEVFSKTLVVAQPDNILYQGVKSADGSSTSILVQDAKEIPTTPSNLNPNPPENSPKSLLISEDENTPDHTIEQLKSQESYGYEKKKEALGYKDASTEIPKLEEEYGYKEFGYEPSDQTYGRQTYQVPSKFFDKNKTLTNSLGN